MDDLVAFLRARLAEDEEWTRHLPGDANYERCLTTGALSINNDRALSALASPQRLLADVDAKRRIIDWHPLTDQIINPGYGKHVADFGCTACHDWDGVTEGRGYCQTLRLLVLPYAGHSDYQPDWAPDA